MKLPFRKQRGVEGLPTKEQIFQNRPITEKDIIAPSSINVKQDNIQLGNRLAKSFFIFSYPRHLNTAWLSSAINLGISMDISLFIHPLDAGYILRKLRRRVTEVQSEIMDEESKGLVHNPELETAFQDIEVLRDRLQTAQERMFLFGLYITVYAQTVEELREIQATLRSIFESRLMYIKPALYQQKEGFHSCLPYGTDLLQVHNSMNTEPLSSCFPFVSFDLSSSEGIMYGINRHNNSMILFDRFSLENANSTIFATSGSGKSIVGTEPVLIRRNGKIELVQIGDLIETIIAERGASKIDEELEGVIDPGVEVYSFNKNLKNEWSRVTVAARKTAPNTFYKFTTKSGREITATGDHNMLVLRHGKVIAAKSTDVQKGEAIPLPRSIKNIQEAPIFLNLFELLKDSEGIYIANTAQFIKNYYGAIKSLGIANISNDYLTTYKRGVRIPIKLFAAILEHLGIPADDPSLSDLLISHSKANPRELPLRLKTTEEFLSILGLIAAEGYTHHSSVNISNIDHEVLAAIENSLARLGIPCRRLMNARKKRYEGIQIQNRIFVELIKALGADGHCDQKRVPSFVFSLPDNQISPYLAAYFEGDGCVDTKNAAVFAASTSKQLLSEMAYLLYYFGIIGRIHKIKKQKEDRSRRDAWTLSISGQENLGAFARQIGFLSIRKNQRLAYLLNKKAHTGVDFIPGIEPLLKELHLLLEPQLHNMRQFQDWKNGKKRPAPQELAKMIARIEEKIQYLKNLEPTLQILSELPELSTIIELGNTDKQIKETLGKQLGQSWIWLKKQEYRARSAVALEAISLLNNKPYALANIKETIRLGFKELDLPATLSLRALEPRYAEKNTLYETIQKSAQHVWENYQEMRHVKIPRVEALLSQLKSLAASGLFWDPIAQIEKINNASEQYVYDLTVDNEVFLAGQAGMFVHNSYAVKLEILRYLMMGVECIILDPENEYKTLAEQAGGSFFDISLGSPSHINPFDLPEPREDERPEDILRSNVVNLVGLMRLALGGLTPEEDAIMDRAITETYAAKDITPATNPATWKDKIPLMQDLEEVLQGMEGTDSLVRRLHKFTKGTYANFFNQPSNITLKTNIVSFGIREMEDSLRPMAIYIIMRHVWNTVRSELKKRIFVLDEAWWIMQSEDGASFLFGMVKRARKYWLGVTTITQDVDDFMRSPYGKPIITNSSIQLLLKQSPAAIDLVQQAFALTSEERILLLETAVGEGIFCAGQKHVAIRVVASPAEHEMITTAPEEIARRQAKKQMEGEPEFGVEREEKSETEGASDQEDPYKQADNNL